MARARTTTVDLKAACHPATKVTARVVKVVVTKATAKAVKVPVAMAVPAQVAMAMTRATAAVVKVVRARAKVETSVTLPALLTVVAELTEAVQTTCLELPKPLLSTLDPLETTQCSAKHSTQSKATAHRAKTSTSKTLFARTRLCTVVVVEAPARPPRLELWAGVYFHGCDIRRIY